MRDIVPDFLLRYPKVHVFCACDPATSVAKMFDQEHSGAYCPRGLLGEQPFDFCTREIFAIECHLYPEVEQRVQPQLRRRIAPNRCCDLRAGGAIHAPGRAGIRTTTPAPSSAGTSRRNCSVCCTHPTRSTMQSAPRCGGNSPNDRHTDDKWLQLVLGGTPAPPKATTARRSI
jgi:hypothetical protein